MKEPVAELLLLLLMMIGTTSAHTACTCTHPALFVPTIYAYPCLHPALDVCVRLSLQRW
jgi:hypothetical protein